MDHLFDHSFDFSKAYDTIMRALTIIDVSFLVFSYIPHSGMHARVYDKLLRALTTSELLQPPIASSWESDSLGALNI